MGFVTRELSISYGSLTIGGTSQVFIPMGGWIFERDYREGRVSAEVLVRGTSTADLNTQLGTFLGQIKLRNQALTVIVNSQTIVSASHTNATGFNTYAEAREKVDSEAQTGLTRHYDVEWRFQVPETSALAGRRDSSVSVRYTASRLRTVTIRCEYTAISSAGALAQYQAAIGAYASSVQTLLGITAWQLIREEIPIDDQNRLIVNATQVS